MTILNTSYSVINGEIMLTYIVYICFPKKIDKFLKLEIRVVWGREFKHLNHIYRHFRHHRSLKSVFKYSIFKFMCVGREL